MKANVNLDYNLHLYTTSLRNPVCADKSIYRRKLKGDINISAVPPELDRHKNSVILPYREYS